MNAGVATLTFDETIKISTFNVKKCSIQSAVEATPSTLPLPFTGGDVSTSDSTVITIQISENDLNSLKLNTATATLANNTYLVLPANALQDMSKNDVEPHLDGAAREADVLVPDDTEPKLESFKMNLESRTIDLFFNEAVDNSTFDTTQLQFHGDGDARDSTPLNSFNMSEAQVTFISTYGTHFTVTFTKGNAEKIKQLDLCSEKEDCFLLISPSLVQDMAANSLEAGAPDDLIRATFFTSDATRPSLIEFTSFNMDDGTIALTFSESMNTSSVNATALSLHSYFDDSRSDTITVTLQGAAKVEGGNTEKLKIHLLAPDLNNIKATEELCVSERACYVRFSTYFIDDLNRNPVRAVLSTKTFSAADGIAEASTVIDDTTPPALLSASYSLKTGKLDLTFNEPVNYAEFRPANNIAFQPSANGGVSLKLTTARDTSIATFVGTEMSVVLSNEDQLKVKARTDLATSLDNLFVTVTSNLVRDVSAAIKNGLANDIINSTHALQIEELTLDTVRPAPEEFTAFDNNVGSITVKFSNYANLSSVDFTGFTLFGATADNNYTLQHIGTVDYLDPAIKTTLVITVSSLDLRNIRLQSGLCASKESCKLSVAEGAVAYSYGLSSDASPNALSVADYTADTTAPQLTDFVLDMNELAIIMTFNDVVDVGQMIPEELVLQNEATKDTVSVALTGGSSDSPDAFEMVLDLSDADANSIKLLDTLGTTVNNTFVHLNTLFIKDAAGAAVRAIGRTSALQAAEVRPDLTRPKIVSFDLNMNDAELLITFSEVVDLESFSLAKIILSGNATGSIASLTLSDAQSVRVLGTTFPKNLVVVAELTSTDFNLLTADDNVATGASNTYLSAANETVRDTVGLLTVPIPGTSGMAVTQFDEDVTPPVATGFEVDLDAGEASFTFSETVRPSSLNATVVTFTNAPADGTPASTVTLGNATLLSADPATTVKFKVAVSDLDALKLLPTLATEAGNTALLLKEGVVNDMNGNPAKAVTTALDNPTYNADSTPARLSEFDLNMNTGVLTLTFDEPVKASSFQGKFVTLQSTRQYDADTESWTLTSSNVVTGTKNGRVIPVQLSVEDKRMIQQLDTLATNVSTTFLVATVQTITDMTGSNGLSPVRATDAREVTKYDRDETAPKFVGLAVDMNRTTITLNFDEPVRATTLNVTRITLQSEKASIPGALLPLTGGTTASENGLQIVVVLSDADANAVKANLALFVSRLTSAVSVAAGCISDMAGNIITSQTYSQAIVATTFVADARQPIIVAFGLNMNNQRLQLDLSETVHSSTLDPTKLTLQSSSDARVSGQVSLSGGSVLTAINSTTVVIELNLDDLNALKYRLIGSASSMTWLVAEEGAVLDTVGQKSAARTNNANALQVTGINLQSDSGAPILTAYELDMELGTVTLVFDETVDGDTAQAEKIQIFAGRNDSAHAYRLTNNSRSCTQCGTMQYELSTCGRGTDRECEDCRECGTNEYFTVACTNTTNSECAACSSCAADQFVAAACEGFSDTLCHNCTTTCPNGEYTLHSCNSTHDMECATCSVCKDTEFVAAACNATHDTVCKSHRERCPVGEYLTAMGTLESDIECATCSTCDSSNQFELRGCASVSDTVCANCTVPGVEEYANVSCSDTSDAIMEPCTVCSVGEFAEVACGANNGASDRKCSKCSECGVGEFVKTRCTLESDTECGFCPTNCEECGAQGTCTKCSTGTVMLDGNVGCASQCPGGFYNDNGVCRTCEGSCGTCNGPSSYDCLTCRPGGAFIKQTNALGNNGIVCSTSCDLSRDKKYDGKDASGKPKCLLCDDSCSLYNTQTLQGGCFGPGPDACRGCADSTHVMTAHTCHAECPDGWYLPDPSSVNCARCPAHCKTCSADGSKCLTCDDGKYLDTVTGTCNTICGSVFNYGS
jgi:hypothetical protein